MRCSPALSASLEYYKYCAGIHLPSQFMEAELDYFGAHSYDKKSEGPGEVKKGVCTVSYSSGNSADCGRTGKHHFEWKPA